MADSDKILSLLIQVGVLGADDVKAFNELLQESKQSAADLGTSIPDNLQQGFKPFINGTKEAKEGVDELGESLHGLSKGASIIGLTEQAHLLHAALNPITITIAGFAIGMEAYFGWQEKALERQKEMTLELQKHNDYLREYNKLRGDANVLEVEHAQSLAKAREEVQGLGVDLARTAELRQIFEAEQKNSQEDREKSATRENELLDKRLVILQTIGSITKSQAEQAELAAQHTQKLAEIQNNISDKHATVTATQSAINDYIDKIFGQGIQVSGNAAGGYSVSPEQIAAADSRAAAAKRNADLQESIVKTGPDELRRLQEEREKAEGRRRDHGSEYDIASGKLVSQVVSEQIDVLDQQIANQKNLIESAKTNLQSAENAAAETAETARVLHDSNKTLREMFDALNAAKGEFVRAQNQGSKDISAENQKYAIDAITALLKGGSSPQSIFNDAINAMSALDHMQENTGHTPEFWRNRGTPQQQAYVQHLQEQVAALTQMVNAIGGNGNNLVAAVNSIVAKQSQSQAELHAATMGWMNSVIAQIEKMTGQIRGMRFNFQ